MSRPGHLPPHLLHRIGTALAVATLTLLLSQPAEAGRARRRPRPRPVAGVPAQPAPAPTAPQPVSTPTAAGMVVGVDPETGRLGMPTAEQMIALTAQERTGLMRTAEGLTEVRRPDGSVMVDLQGRFQCFSVLRLDAQGRPQIVPADDLTSLLRALTQPAPVLEEK